jgi:hypothetical protein
MSSDKLNKLSSDNFNNFVIDFDIIFNLKFECFLSINFDW